MDDGTVWLVNPDGSEVQVMGTGGGAMGLAGGALDGSYPNPGLAAFTGTEWFVDGVLGDDSKSGRNWNKAVKTVNQAMSLANHGDTIYVGDLPSDTSQGDILVDKVVRLVFPGNAQTINTPGLVPSSATAKAVTIAIDGARIENLKVLANGYDTFTGYGIYINGEDTGTGNYASIANYLYYGPDDSSAGHLVYGGTGIFLREAGEGIHIEHCHIQNAHIGWKREQETSSGYSCDVNFISCWRDIEFGVDNPTGGWVHVKQKAVQQTATVADHDAVLIGPGCDSEVWVGVDWHEAFNHHVRVQGNGHRFYGPTGAPETNWVFEGDNIRVHGAKGGEWNFNGDDCHIFDSEFLGTLRGTGNRNRLTNTQLRGEANSQPSIGVTGDSWVYDNCALGTTPITDPSTLGARPRFGQFYGQGSEPPTSGPWRQGDWYLNDVPVAGGVPGWVCLADDPTSPADWGLMAALTVPVWFPTTPLLDDFDRADSALTPTANWVAVDQGALEVFSDEVRAPDAAVGDARWIGSSFAADQEAWVTVVVKPGATGEIAGLYTRLELATYDGYLFILREVEPGTDEWKIFKYESGFPTQLGSTATGPELTDGDRIAFSAVGTDLTGYVYHGGAWQSVITVSDATFTGAGYVGMTLSDPGTRVGRLDDFGGGSII